MIEFLDTINDILTMPERILRQATQALNDIQFDQTLLYEYMGYMHYAMGTPLYMGFASLALIMVGVALFTIIIKTVNWIMGMLPIL